MVYGVLSLCSVMYSISTTIIVQPYQLHLQRRPIHPNHKSHSMPHQPRNAPPTTSRPTAVLPSPSHPLQVCLNYLFKSSLEPAHGRLLYGVEPGNWKICVVNNVRLYLMIRMRLWIWQGGGGWIVAWVWRGGSMMSRMGEEGKGWGNIFCVNTLFRSGSWE